MNLRLVFAARRAGAVEATTPSITCPRCGMTSFNPNDIKQRYCGNCCWWTSDPILGQVSPDDAE